MSSGLSPSARPHLAGVRNYQPGKPIEEVEREYNIRGAVKMASNENPLGPSPKAVAAIRKNLSKLHRYPDGGSFYLRNRLAKFHGVSGDQLIFGNGSDELLVFAVRAFAEAGDEVIIANPTFLIYEIACQVEKAVCIKVPMKDFRYDLDGMLAKLTTRTKLIFIANPDNPVGTYISEKKLAEFLKRVPRNVIVVLDEAYYEFAAENKDYPNSLMLLGTYGNLIITRTFSKAYGLSGLRIGYGIADASIVRALNKVREPFNVNSLAQAGAIAALDDKAHLKKTLKAVREGRRYLRRELETMRFEIVDTATNFMLINLKREAAPIHEKLLKKGVIIRPMTAWGMQNFIRVTIGLKKENERFVRALKEATRS